MKSILVHFCFLVSISVLTLTGTGCSESSEKTPAPPVNSKAVQEFLKGKKLTVKQVGFYSNTSLNANRDVEWLDLAGEKSEMVKTAAEEEKSLTLQFLNDTSVTVNKKAKQFTGTFEISDKAEENEQPGIRLKLTYPDPEFGFGGTPMEVTYSYLVAGLDTKSILLETPRTINRQKLLSLMSE